MKARVKATGEIVEVMYSHTANDKGHDIIWYITPQGASFTEDELEFIDTEENFDYWTRLEHQYVGMAMQGLLAGPAITLWASEVIMQKAIEYATALVEKLKNE